jgi:single-stranded DNA-specific DHH superfamily exonuclease
MSKITFQEAKEFLNKISKEDKVAIVHHNDGDGLCAGILFYEWCEKKGATTEEFSFSIGDSSLKDYNLEQFNKIIICDIAPGLIYQDLQEIRNKKVFYTDHHKEEEPIPEEILELRTLEDGYIPSSRTAQELTELKPWLGLIGTITDMGEAYPENEKYIEARLKEINLTLNDFKEQITNTITNTIVYFKEEPKKIFKILKNLKSIKEIKNLEQFSEPIEEEITKFVKEYEIKKERLGDINFYQFDPQFSIRKIVISIIGRQFPEEDFIFATPVNDGKRLSISGRSPSKKTDMAELLKAGVKELENTNAGGHSPAAGAQIETKDIEKFKKNIRNYIETNF